MHVPDDIIALMREHASESWLTVLQPGEADSFDAVAGIAGVEPLGERWTEVELDQAVHYLAVLLHQSLAHRTELLPWTTAYQVATQFLGAVAGDGSRYATNCGGVPGEAGVSWDPATEYTFDAGVVAIGERGAVLYWVADED